MPIIFNAFIPLDHLPVSQVCQKLSFSHPYAFYFLIASGEKKHRSESEANFCLMNSPATKFWVPFLMDAAKRAWDAEGKETVQIFGGEEFEANLIQCSN